MTSFTICQSLIHSTPILLAWARGLQSMLVIPAVDLKDGRCVRLRQGDMQDETVYSEDPPATALQWQQRGARMLHVVDLNGAVDGQPGNLPQIEAILKVVAIPVQVGGGLRRIETIRQYLRCGAARVVLGTAALRDPRLLEQACAEFPKQIVLGLDAKGGMVATSGWTNLSETKAIDLLVELSTRALAGVVYTDIARDGMLGGPNLEALREVLARSPFALIASGGITTVEDVRAIKALGPGIEGVIVGKALYDGKLDFASALQAAA